MSFYQFLIYFFVSHLFYTIVLTGINELYILYRSRKNQKLFREMLKSGQIEVVDLDALGEEEKWH